MQNLSWSAERGMPDGSGVDFDLPRSPLETEKSCMDIMLFVIEVYITANMAKVHVWISCYLCMYNI